MSEPTSEAVRPDQQERHEFYEAFRVWFNGSGCDFWSECDAPESLAVIAVEISSRYAAAAVARERGRCREIVVQMRNQRQAYRQIIGDPKAQLPQYKHWTEDMINDLTGQDRDE